MRKRKYMYTILALVGVLALGIVYAATTGLLNFSGTAVINPNVKVVFDSARIENGTASDTYSISPDGQSLTFSVNLAGQDDYADIYFALANTGNVPVVLGNLTDTTPGADGTVTVTWPDNMDGYTFGAGSGMQWDKSIRLTLSDPFATTGSRTFTATLNYEQDTSQ
jgi:hypothetical protein